jgi:hypothetical protein
MSKKPRLPSPAMIVALLSLCVALGGSAYAASKINGKNIKNGTITGKKLKNRTLSSRKLTKGAVNSLKGSRGLRGPRGYRGTRGPKGSKGDKGADGAALAYARVQSDGTVDTTRSKSIAQTNVSHPTEGIYCFVSLTFNPKNVVATLEPVTGDEVVYATIPAPSPSLGCPAGAVTVQVKHSGAAGTNANRTFYIAFN